MRRRGPTDGMPVRRPRTPSAVATARVFWRVSRVYWLIVIYSGAWIVLRFLGIGGPALPLDSLATLAAIFVLEVLNLGFRTRSAARRYGLRRAEHTRIGWLFTALDLLIVSVGLRLTGGAASGLWPILFVIVVAETVLEPLREAWIVRVGVCLALFVASVPIPFQIGPWLLDTVTRGVLLMAVTSVARRLRENSDNEKAELAALRAELAVNEERLHLSREVHDGVGNSLAAAVLRLELSARVLERSRPADETIAVLRDEAQSLRQSMTSVRDWTFWTRPWSVVEANGTLRGSELLVSEVERIARRTGLAIKVEGAEKLDDAGSASSSLRLTVLRIAQEALTNVAKHAASASEVRICLSIEGQLLQLQIADNGGGIVDASGLPGSMLPDASGSGVGLASMRERAHGAGGTLAIESSSETGTTITARLPIA